MSCAAAATAPRSWPRATVTRYRFGRIPLAASVGCDEGSPGSPAAAPAPLCGVRRRRAFLSPPGGELAGCAPGRSHGPGEDHHGHRRDCYQGADSRRPLRSRHWRPPFPATARATPPAPSGLPPEGWWRRRRGTDRARARRPDQGESRGASGDRARAPRTDHSAAARRDAVRRPARPLPGAAEPAQHRAAPCRARTRRARRGCGPPAPACDDAVPGWVALLILQARHRGLRIVWAADAVVTEHVPAERARAGWLCRRAYRVGVTLGALAATEAAADDPPRPRGDVGRAGPGGPGGGGVLDGVAGPRRRRGGAVARLPRSTHVPAEAAKHGAVSTVATGDGPRQRAAGRHAYPSVLAAGRPVAHAGTALAVPRQLPTRPPGPVR
jgi:hypothetical protein